MAVLEISNESGVFRFVDYEKGVKRWVCIRSTVQGFSPMCYVPFSFGHKLSIQAREEGATDADFGIEPEKPKRTRKAGGSKMPKGLTMIFSL